MLKKRLIATLNVKDGIVVQSLGFNQYLPVGKPHIAVDFLNQWGIDEIVLLDISATPKNKEPDYELVKKVSQHCLVPLAVGGGISNSDQILKLIHCGADKVVLNSSLVDNPQLLSQAWPIFGKQCLVASVDAKKNETGSYDVYTHSGTTKTDKDLVSWVKELEDHGAGEILINSIDNDGQKQGYDLDLLKTVSDSVHIPVIGCGGVGHPKHFEEGFSQGKIQAAAAGNFFHFTEHSANTTKTFLRYDGYILRHDTQANYESFQFNQEGRLSKKPDEVLNHLRFKFEPEETI